MAKESVKATTDVKSGVTNDSYVKQLGGQPPKKSVEQIEKVNTPGKAPGASRD